MFLIQHEISLTFTQGEGGRWTSDLNKGDFIYKFKIESMNCMSCVHNIEDALKESDHSVSVKADIKNKVLNVERKMSLFDIKKK